MSEVTNSNIIREIQTRDETAFSRLFDSHYQALCFFASKYVKDMDLSRSLVQQVFVDMWIKRDKIHITHSEKSYLYQAVRNKTIDYLRKEKHNSEIIEADHTSLKTPFEDLVEEAELSARISSSINLLPERCRDIFILCRFEGLKYTQIAERLNISVKTVEMQMGIALKRLRERLNG